MKVRTRIGRIFKPFVNVPRWMGIRQLWANGQVIMKSIQDLKIHRPPVRSESFEEAKARLNLTDEDIQKRQRTCLLLSIIYTIACFLFLIYTFYMIIHLKLGMIVGILITCLMAVFAYREHFWYFQLKTKTLGNSFQNWFTFLLRGGRK